MKELQYELVPLTEENIPYISMRSGKTEKELLLMLAYLKLERREISVRFLVKETPKQKRRRRK